MTRVIELPDEQYAALVDYLHGRGLDTDYGSDLGQALESLMSQSEPVAVKALREAALLLSVNGGGRGYVVKDTACDALMVVTAALEVLGVQWRT